MKAIRKKMTSKGMTESQENFQLKWKPENSGVKSTHVEEKTEQIREIIIKER